MMGHRKQSSASSSSLLLEMPALSSCFANEQAYQQPIRKQPGPGSRASDSSAKEGLGFHPARALERRRRVGGKGTRAAGIDAGDADLHSLHAGIIKERVIPVRCRKWKGKSFSQCLMTNPYSSTLKGLNPEASMRYRSRWVASSTCTLQARFFSSS